MRFPGDHHDAPWTRVQLWAGPSSHSNSSHFPTKQCVLPPVIHTVAQWTQQTTVVVNACASSHTHSDVSRPLSSLPVTGTVSVWCHVVEPRQRLVRSWDAGGRSLWRLTVNCVCVCVCWQPEFPLAGWTRVCMSLQMHLFTLRVLDPARAQCCVVTG